METLVLCRSDMGDGGWSLHPPGSTDEQIACGEAPPLNIGFAKRDKNGEWTRPNKYDYRTAMRRLCKRQAALESMRPLNWFIS